MKKQGRPTKLTQELIDAINKVLNDKDIIVMTDEELVMFLNEELPKENKISDIAFAKWKGGELPEINADKKIIKKFLYVIKKALYTERFNLLKDLKKGENNWQSKAWILERKFNEWNLKHIAETDIKINPEDIPKIKWTD